MTRRKAPTYEVIRQLFFDEGLSLRDIAKRYDTVHTSVYRYARRGAKEHGHTWPFKRKPWPQYTKVKFEYEQGKSWQQLADQYGFNIYGLREHMKGRAKKLGDPWPFRDRISTGGHDLIVTVGITGELRDYIEKYGWKHEEIAKEAGVSRSYISRLVSGGQNGSGHKSKNPRISRVHATRIVEALVRMEKAHNKRRGVTIAQQTRLANLAEKKAS